MADLADEQDHRRGVLIGDVNPGGRIGGARSPGHETDPRRAGHLAVGLGHHGGPALLPADDGADGVLAVQSVQRRQVALPRHAEHRIAALDAQLVDQDLAAVTFGHGRTFPSIAEVRNPHSPRAAIQRHFPGLPPASNRDTLAPSTKREHGL